MDTDKHKFIITWCDAVTGITETRKANEQEIQELLVAGYGKNALAEDAPVDEETATEEAPVVEETPVVDDLVEGEQP